jgi:Vacuolar protein sorting-associated protein 62/Bacterial SH3 domain
MKTAQSIITILILGMTLNMFINEHALAEAPLVTKNTCSLEQKWKDKGSGADLDGYFYIPSTEPTYYMIGGYGTQDKKLSSADCVLAVHESDHLVAPKDWELIWKDKGSGAKKDGSMWRAIPPSEEYQCIGSVPQKGYEKPYIPSYRCVHMSLTEPVITSDLIWSDKGSGAKNKVTMFKLPNTGSFIAAEGRLSQLEAFDLKLNLSLTPNDKTPVSKLEEIFKSSIELTEESDNSKNIIIKPAHNASDNDLSERLQDTSVKATKNENIEKASISQNNEIQPPIKKKEIVNKTPVAKIISEPSGLNNTPEEITRLQTGTEDVEKEQEPEPIINNVILEKELPQEVVQESAITEKSNTTKKTANRQSKHKKYKATKDANIRKSPTTNSIIIGKLLLLDHVNAIKVEGKEWYQIKDYSGIETGYVHESLLTEVPLAERLFLPALVLSIIAIPVLLIGAVTNKVVIFYNVKDFIWTASPIFIITLASVFEAVVDPDQIYDDNLVIIFTMIPALACYLISFNYSTKYNGTIMGVLVGIFKIASSIIVSLLMLGLVARLFNKSNNHAVRLMTIMLLGVLTWFTQKLINGERVKLVREEKMRLNGDAIPKTQSKLSRTSLTITNTICWLIAIFIITNIALQAFWLENIDKIPYNLMVIAVPIMGLIAIRNKKLNYSESSGSG